MKRESGFQARALKRLNSFDQCKALALQPGYNGIETGTPDIIGSWTGHCFLIETKRDASNQPTKIQEYRILQWRYVGATVFVCNSNKDVEAFIMYMREHYG